MDLMELYGFFGISAIYPLGSMVVFQVFLGIEGFDRSW